MGKQSPADIPHLILWSVGRGGNGAMATVDLSSGLSNLSNELGTAGLVPRAQPRDAAECAALLRDAAGGDSAVVPWGGGTQQALGAPPARCDLILSTGAMRGIDFHRPEDLTIGVRAGTTLGEVRDQLAAYGQFLPLDAALPEVATIGGLVATGLAPVRRFRYGSIRDLVIGIEAALTDGSLCRGGGRVVKNVAGYDLCKLFTGSLGTLGVITGVNFKVQPRPSMQVLIAGEFVRQEPAFAAARTIAQASLCCAAVLVEGTRSTGVWRLSVVAEGFGGAVNRQVAEAQREIERRDGLMTLMDDAGGVASALRALAERRVVPAGSGSLLLRGSVAPAGLADALAGLTGLLEHTSELNYLQADVPLGTWYLTVWPRPSDVPGGAPEVEMLGRARALIGELGGHLVIEAGPVELRRRIDPWGAPSDGEGLAWRIKRQLDPADILNPRRFAYGI
jgi:glycolate oxidase FAD binding subunit